jgi:hypothetical protein
MYYFTIEAICKSILNPENTDMAVRFYQITGNALICRIGSIHDGMPSRAMWSVDTLTKYAFA